MIVNGTHYRTIWEKTDGSGLVEIIDQRLLPFEFKTAILARPEDYIYAIKEMQVRGAPLIGATAAYAVYCACTVAEEANFDEYLAAFANELANSRPTAFNLEWAIQKSLDSIASLAGKMEKTKAALESARKIASDDVENCLKIGEFGLDIIREISQRKKGDTVNILTHCNAGWLATIDYGTATAPIYKAFDEGIGIHVWVDETRPRNQGSRLTAWELNNHGVPNTIIVDNAGGYLMQMGAVDLVIVGSDRTTADGYVVNKVGTYLKALAAADIGIPFYVALPRSSINNGFSDEHSFIIEERHENEVLYTEGFSDGGIVSVRTAAFNTQALNIAFDVTPPYLVTGLITEKGVVKPGLEEISSILTELPD